MFGTWNSQHKQLLSNYPDGGESRYRSVLIPVFEDIRAAVRFKCVYILTRISKSETIQAKPLKSLKSKSKNLLHNKKYRLILLTK